MNFESSRVIVQRDFRRQRAADLFELGLDALDDGDRVLARWRAGRRASPPARRSATPPGARPLGGCPRRGRRREMRMGVPFTVATMISSNCAGGVERVPACAAGSPTCPARRCRPAPRRSRSAIASLDVADREPVAVQLLESTTMWISRARPPPRSTWPTPSTVSMHALHLLVGDLGQSSRRLIVSDDSTTEMIGIGVGIHLLDDRREHAVAAGRAAPRPPSRGRRWRRR